ncbi:mechanosensitive ion channel family protein [Hazenella coriacea]|uniref:Small conductance mechanosensitive channel n=1 Tax=Hazenella coriacea TaxID=1179467 RepID=A0A4R3LH70_9BACL|nr:mechanosensitive ion channel family protein [Hazenella coriacea]TCS96866.1 small conductance mechanosensitive channel [Hazenella coriacea]
MIAWKLEGTLLLQKLVTTVIIIIVAWAIFWIAKRVLIRLLTQGKKLGNGQKHRIDTLQSLLSNIIGYTIFFIALVAILGQFNIDATGMVASAGIIGLAIGFGAKDLVSDVVTGFFVLLEDQINVGEHVTVNGYSGIVENVGMRIIKIRSDNGDLHFIPNRDIKALTNHSRGEQSAIVDLPVSSELNIDDVIQLLEKKCKQIEHHMDHLIEGPHLLGVQTVSMSEIVIRIIARTENGYQALVERELRRELKRALDQAELVKSL